MRKVNFMKALATVFFTASVALFSACVDQDNSELKQPKSPDDPIITPAKLKLTPDLDIRTGEAELTLKADSGSLSDKSSIMAYYKATVAKNPLQITSDMVVKVYTYGELKSTKTNNVTTAYSMDINVNDANTIQAICTTSEGVVLGDHKFGIIVDSIRANGKSTEASKVGYSNAKAVYNTPTDITFFCHEYGTGRTNNFEVVVPVNYTTWIAEDGTEKIGERLGNFKREVKNFIDTQKLDIIYTWKKGDETWETTEAQTNSEPFVVKPVTLEDLYTSNFDLAKVVPAGITLGIESTDTIKHENSYFSYVEKMDTYVADRTIGGSNQRTTYLMTNRKVFFQKGNLKATFGFIQPTVKEVSDYMNPNYTSDREGHDMRLFENIIQVSYGVDSTGVSRDNFSENGKVYVKKNDPKPQEVTVKDVDVTVTVAIDLDALTETATAKGTITYSDNTTKTVDLTRTDNIKFNVNPAWSIAGKEATQTTSDFGYKKTSSSAKTANVEGKDYTASWAYDAESWATTEKVTSNNVEKSNGTTLDLYNNYAITVEGHTFKASAITISAATSNDHLTKDSESGLTSTYYYVVNHTWSVGGQAKELHPSGTLTITADDYVVSRRFYDIKNWDESPTSYYHIAQLTTYASGKEVKEEADLNFINGILVGQSWRSEEVDNTDNSGTPILTENSREDVTKSLWKYQVVNTGISIENLLAGSKQYDNYVATTIDGVEVTMNGETYKFPRRTVSATASKSLTKVSDNEYAHANVLSFTTSDGSASSILTATANGTIVIKANDPEPEEKKWGAYLGYKVCAALSKDSKSTVVGYTLRFEKGSLPVAVKANGEVAEGDFEPGSFIYDGATYTDGGDIVNCYTSKDDNFGLLWYRGANDVVKMKSFTDLTRMKFNWEHNVFTPQKYDVLNADKSGNDITFSISGTNWTMKY